VRVWERFGLRRVRNVSTEKILPFPVIVRYIHRWLQQQQTGSFQVPSPGLTYVTLVAGSRSTLQIAAATIGLNSPGVESKRSVLGSAATKCALGLPFERRVDHGSRRPRPKRPALDTTSPALSACASLGAQRKRTHEPGHTPKVPANPRSEASSQRPSSSIHPSRLLLFGCAKKQSDRVQLAP
jgi:hypothetical protein